MYARRSFPPAALPLLSQPFPTSVAPFSLITASVAQVSLVPGLAVLSASPVSGDSLFSLLNQPGAFPLRELQRVSFREMLSMLHCSFAAPTPAVPDAPLSCVFPLSLIDLVNFVEGSIADPRGWRPLLDQVLSHDPIVLVLIPDGST